LSFRDLMWLSFLPNHRLDNRELLHERHFVENLKLRQVIEVLFGVHDDQAAKLGEAVRTAEGEKSELESEIRSLGLFLDEQDVPDQLQLEAELNVLTAQLSDIEKRLAEVSQTMRARTEFAQELRHEYGERVQAARRAAAVIRDRETLLHRLLPLRSQYAEDESKLIFHQEAETLFDPLRVTVCPSCQQRLQGSVTIEEGTCTLCGQAVLPSDSDIDVASELRAVRDRRREIDRYVEEVEGELAAATKAYRTATAAESEAQQRLDSEVAQALSPFVGERDLLIQEREDGRAKVEDVERKMSWHEALERRRTDLSRLEARLSALREDIRTREKDRPSREEVVDDLSRRFRSILSDFGFPKLDDPEPPYLDAKFVPHVRGNVYREIGSTGALTLISLAWYVAIFERVLEIGGPHPGFLMIDSPQKNLRPREGEGRDEFSDEAIAGLVWDRLLQVTGRESRDGQLIVVDNRPPQQVHSAVVVEYSARPERPPYGFIDNETG
jgi:hypothetical protein